jgi:serine protease Do
MKPILALFVVLAAAGSAFAQETGWIGVSIAEQPDRGVLVRTVEPNSPAERAGLKANDIVLQYNQQEVVGVQQMTRLVNETPVGRSVDVTVRRDNREQTLKVTTERAPFGIGPIRVQRPDLSALRDRVGKTLPPFEVLTTVSVSQAGVRADSLTPQLRDFFGVKAGEGVLVASVDENSAAAKAGLQAGDVVTAVDGRSVSSPSAFNREMRSRTTAATLKVVRNKQEREIRIEK